MKASYIVQLLFTQDILFVIASFRAFQTGCICVTSRTWNNFYRMHLIHQFGSERTWTLQKLTHPSPKVTCWGSHRNVYQHLRWGVTHKENMQFR